ncbi:MAG: serine protease [Candidatus Aceula meridiana]|nr:serine protease [Candidatus Aceula meridiana]
MKFFKIIHSFLIIGFALICPKIALAQSNVIEKIQLAIPSIVEIHSKSAAMVKGPGSTFLDKITGKIVQLKGIRAVQVTKNGSGVIIDPVGVIVTNAHVVSNAGRIDVTLHDGTTVEATPLKVIPNQDLAFLKIEPPFPLTRVEIANSQAVPMGAEVITVGSSPFLKKTISAGRITGVAKSMRQGPSEPEGLFRVNINIYHGDSGGPLFNYRGHLVGLMVARQMEQDRFTFAIPSNTILKSYLEYLKTLKR